MSSRDHAGCRTSPRGRNSAITGLMSTTGVPSIASRPATSSARPSRRTRRADRRAEAVGAHLRALGEDADARPGRVAARVARPALDLGRADAVEDVNHLDVRERLEAVERFGGEIGRELEARAHPIPVVVDGIGAIAADVRDGLEVDHGWMVPRWPRAPLASSLTSPGSSSP